MRTKPFDLEAAKAGAKVVTRDGRQVRIICWDAKLKLNSPIVALVTMDNGDELTNRYNNYGECLGVPTKESPSDLFLLDESETELTEFEEELWGLMLNPSLGEIPETAKKVAKVIAPKFLAIAKKELRLEVEAEYWGTQKPYFKGKEDGRAELLKDLPKWRKFKDICEFFTEEEDCITTEPIIVKGLINDDDYHIINKGVMVNDELYAIKISDLKKLSKEE